MYSYHSYDNDEGYRRESRLECLFNYIHNNDPDGVSEMLAWGTHVDSEEDDWSAAGLSIYLGHAKCLRVLLQNGASMTRSMTMEQSLLDLAVSGGHTECIKLLLKYGALRKDPEVAYNIFVSAARNGNLERVKLFVKYGAKVDSVDSEGETPLAAAAESGCVNCVQFLLDKGANLMQEAAMGIPLFYAARYGTPECVRFLYEKMDESDKNDHSNKNKATLYAALGNQPANLVLMRAYGADIESTIRPEQQTVLAIAARFGYSECVKTLLEMGAEIEKTDRYGMTPLFLAILSKDMECLSLLIEHKANLEARENADLTPLAYAAFYNYPEAVKLLIEKGAQVEASNAAGETPLILAAYRHENIARILIASGANIEAVTKNGKSVLESARCMPPCEELVRHVLRQLKLRRCLRGIIRFFILASRYREDFYRNRYPLLGAKAFGQKKQRLDNLEPLDANREPLRELR